MRSQNSRLISLPPENEVKVQPAKNMTNCLWVFCVFELNSSDPSTNKTEKAFSLQGSDELLMVTMVLKTTMVTRI